VQIAGHAAEKGSEASKSATVRQPGTGTLPCEKSCNKEYKPLARLSGQTLPFEEVTFSLKEKDSSKVGW